MKYRVATWIITGTLLAIVMSIDTWLCIKARRKYRCK